VGEANAEGVRPSSGVKLISRVPEISRPSSGVKLISRVPESRVPEIDI
jgi:hypothetical protein